MKKQMFEVLVDSHIKKFGFNIGMDKIKEFVPGQNHPAYTVFADDNTSDIQTVLKNRIAEIEQDLLKIDPNFFTKFRLNNIIVFHRTVGNKKEMFVTYLDHPIGKPINWLD